jgi:hypothetical protein
MKRMLALALVLTSITLAFVMRTVGKNDDDASREKWEYLVVAGPTTTSFSPSSNGKLRKSEGGFARESFVLEQHLDKLGAEGWQLINVVGQDRDPVFYFKRSK